MYGMTDPLHSLELSRLHYLFTTRLGCTTLCLVQVRIAVCLLPRTCGTLFIHSQLAQPDARKHDKTNAVNRPLRVVLTWLRAVPQPPKRVLSVSLLTHTLTDRGVAFQLKLSPRWPEQPC